MITLHWVVQLQVCSRMHIQARSYANTNTDTHFSIDKDQKKHSGTTSRTHALYNNNVNKLFMVPHLVRACSAYQDIRIHSFHHTHTTNAWITGDGLVEWEERKWQVSIQKRSSWFSVLTKGREWRRWATQIHFLLNEYNNLRSLCSGQSKRQ